MDRYVRVEQPREPRPSIDGNEIRVMSNGKLHSYVAYATTLFTDRGHTAVLLKGMGRAINKTVTVAEVLKRRIPGLHQLTEIASVDLVDTWEPTEEGLSRMETVRHVPVISIHLSKLPLPTDAPGYQPPLTEEERISVRFNGTNSNHGGGRGGRRNQPSSSSSSQPSRPQQSEASSGIGPPDTPPTLHS